jgi:hypothetical protein
VKLSLRFLWVLLLTSCAVSLFIRALCDDFPYGPPAGLRAGVIWGVALLAAALDHLRVRRRLSSL